MSPFEWERTERTRHQALIIAANAYAAAMVYGNRTERDRAEQMLKRAGLNYGFLPPYHRRNQKRPSKRDFAAIKETLVPIHGPGELERMMPV